MGSVSHVSCEVRTASFGDWCWLNSKNEDSTSFRNVGNCLPIDTASHPSRAGCSKG